MESKTAADQQSDQSHRQGVHPVLAALHQPFFDRLQNSKNVLISGCGGGYDFFSGLPLYFALKKAGLNVYLGNLTFTVGVDEITGKRLGPVCVEVTADSKRHRDDEGNDYEWKPSEESYWPEYFVARWFRQKEKMEVPVRLSSGVKPVRESYQAVCDMLHIDTVIVVDGGTDSLMTGNESGLGTPVEDMMTIAAVSDLKNVPQKFLVCLGFGVDAFHGVCHSHFLENASELARAGQFLGAFSLTAEMEEAQKFKSAYVAAQPSNSIVCSSVLDAVEGQFGDHHSALTKSRTLGAKLYISLLMSMFWAFDLHGVAARVLYLPELKETRTGIEVRAAIHSYCSLFYNDKGAYTGPRKDERIPY